MNAPRLMKSCKIRYEKEIIVTIIKEYKIPVKLAGLHGEMNTMWRMECLLTMVESDAGGSAG